MASISQTKIPSVYLYETENKAARIAKLTLSIIFFPIGLYQLCHRLAGYLIIPIAGRDKPPVHSLPAGWSGRPIKFLIDGNTIDAQIIITNPAHRRWMLYSGGNCDFHENLPIRNEKLLTKLNCNALFFNYPGVGESSGMPNRSTMVKAYKAALMLLEEVMLAKEIIGYGYSIGGAVQGEALLNHRLKDDINYVFVKDRTFSSLAKVASSRCIPLGWLVKLLGWDMSPVESSKKLAVPEIILQKMDECGYECKHDGVIPAEAALAPMFIDKHLIELSCDHRDPIEPITLLTKPIEELFKPIDLNSRSA